MSANQKTKKKLLASISVHSCLIEGEVNNDEGNCEDNRRACIAFRADQLGEPRSGGGSGVHAVPKLRGRDREGQVVLF